MVEQKITNECKEHESSTHILEESPIGGEAFGGQSLCDVVERKQGSMLLKTVLDLHGLQQNRDQLGPLPRTVQTCHFSDEHCYLGGNLQYKSNFKRDFKDTSRSRFQSQQHSCLCECINILLNVK